VYPHPMGLSLAPTNFGDFVPGFPRTPPGKSWIFFLENSRTRKVLENHFGPGKSWIFFLENSRTWKVLENHFGPGKSWKLKLKVLESPGKIFLKVMHFSSGSSGKQAAIV